MDDRTRDELAGVVDLFGGLTRDELADALLELAFKRGQSVAELYPTDSGAADQGDEAVVDAAIDAAIHDFYLVEIPERYVIDEPESHGEGDTILAPGPVAFPTLPDGAEDLPHILDTPRRDLDRDVLGAAIVNRFRGEVPDADPERARYLLDVTYDAETWANVDLSGVRTDLESRLDGGS